MMDDSSLVGSVLQKVSEVRDLYYRLIVVLVPAEGSQLALAQQIAQQIQILPINISLELSQRLVGLKPQQRALKSAALLNDVVGGVQNEVVLLTHLELLFEPALRQDPLRMLQALSRHMTVIAIWNGAVEDGYLTYAESGHPEYKRYLVQEFIVMSPGYH